MRKSKKTDIKTKKTDTKYQADINCLKMQKNVISINIQFEKMKFKCIT